MSEKAKTFLWRLLAAEIGGILIASKAGLLAFGIAAIETNPYPAWRAGLIAFLILLGVWNSLMLLFGWILHPDNNGTW